MRPRKSRVDAAAFSLGTTPDAAGGGLAPNAADAQVCAEPRTPQPAGVLLLPDSDREGPDSGMEDDEAAPSFALDGASGDESSCLNEVVDGGRVAGIDTVTDTMLACAVDDNGLGGARAARTEGGVQTGDGVLRDSKRARGSGREDGDGDECGEAATADAPAQPTAVGAAAEAQGALAGAVDAPSVLCADDNAEGLAVDEDVARASARAGSDSDMQLTTALVSPAAGASAEASADDDNARNDDDDDDELKRALQLSLHGTDAAAFQQLPESGPHPAAAVNDGGQTGGALGGADDGANGGGRAGTSEVSAALALALIHI